MRSVPWSVIPKYPPDVITAVQERALVREIERLPFKAFRTVSYGWRGPSCDEWQHSIPPVETLRYSVTMRTFRAA